MQTNFSTSPPPPGQPLPSKLNCEWCNQPMDSDAVRCGSCGKLKKSVYNDKVKSYIFCLLGGLGIGFSFTFLNGNSDNNNFFNASYDGGNSSNHSAGYILLAVGVVSALIGIYFYVRVSQRLKTWWWM